MQDTQIKEETQEPEDNNSNTDSMSSSSRSVKDTHMIDLGRKLLDESKSGNIEEAKLLIAAGAPFTADWVGTSPIHWSAYYNYIGMTEVLLKAGISPDARNKVDRTPLHIACQKGHKEIVELLLAFRAEVNARDMLKMSPLHCATICGQLEIVQTLIEHGATLQPINKFGKTPVEIAIDNAYFNIIKIIEATKAIPIEERSNNVAIKRQESSMIARRLKMFEEDHFPEKVPALNVYSRKKKITDVDNSSNKVHIVQQFDKPQAIRPTAVNGSFTLTKNSSDKAIKVLREHGITILGAENGTHVSSEAQNGISTKLTESGKPPLRKLKIFPTPAVTTPTVTKTNSTSSVSVPVPPSSSPQNVPSSIISSIKSPVKMLANGQRIIKIRADQLINMTKDKRVVIRKGITLKPKLLITKMSTTSGKIDDVGILKEKRTKATAALEENKRRLEITNDVLQACKKSMEDYEKKYEDAKKTYESTQEDLLKIKKQMDETQKEILIYDTSISKLSTKQNGSF